MQTEKQLEEMICNYVREQYLGECLKLRIDGQNGFHDRTIIMDESPVLFMEIKKYKGKPSDKQLAWHLKLWQLSQPTFIVDCFDDAKEIIDYYHHWDCDGRFLGRDLYDRTVKRWL